MKKLILGGFILLVGMLCAMKLDIKVLDRFEDRELRQLADGTVKIYDVATGNPLITLNCLGLEVIEGEISSASFSEYGDKVITRAKGVEKVWDALTGRCLGRKEELETLLSDVHTDLLTRGIMNDQDEDVAEGAATN